MIAYLDTPSGISGDMFLGCLVDAGWSVEALRETVQALNWDGTFDHHGAWSVERREVRKGALRATRVVVQATEVGQPHRHLSDIRALLEGSSLPTPVIEHSVAVFTALAEAEGAVHGEAAEAVHFHEVGALDSIIDIVGVCAGMHALGLSELYAGALPMGPGFTWSQHGKIPLPAPATLELLAQHHAPIKAAPGAGELVTPTGAALVTHFVGQRWRQPEMQLHKVAIGAGKKEFEWPNVARLWIGEPLQPSTKRFQARADTDTDQHQHQHQHHHRHSHPHTDEPHHEHEHDHEHEHEHDHVHSHDNTRNSGFGDRDSGLGTRDSGLGTQNSGRETQNSGRETQNSGRETQNSGRETRDSAVKGPTPSPESRTPNPDHRLMSLLETNIDDMNPEFYAAVGEKLFANGARDVWWTPIQMKKNRPGVTLSVLTTCDDDNDKDKDKQAALANILLRETTTLGLRVHRIARYEAARRMEQVETPFGAIPIKLKILNNEVLGAVPEFDACKRAANTHNVATRQVYEAAAACAWQLFLRDHEAVKSKIQNPKSKI